MMVLKEATLEDWDKLVVFFIKIYRPNHPLQNKEFWNWQYGNSKFGRSFIALNEEGKIVAHVGASFENNLAWIDRKSTRLNSSHSRRSRMPSSA